MIGFGRIAFTAILMGMVAVAPSKAATLLNDSFDTENGGVANSATLNFTAFENWNVTAGGVDLIGNGFLEFFPGNGLYLDLDGTTDRAGRIESKTAFAFSSGDIVNLRFDILGENPQVAPLDNEVTVSLGSLFNETFTVSDVGTISRTFSVSSLTSGSLIFDHAGGDLGGLILDNVQLSSTPVNPKSVPEPSSVALFVSLAALSVGRAAKHIGA